MADKFKTLEHSGVIFPPEYVVKGYQLNGEALTPLAEEKLYKCAAYIESDYWKKDVFKANFYKCLKSDLSENQKKLNWPQDFDILLKKMYNDIQTEKENKKLYNKANKESIKQKKESDKATFGWAMLDGKKQPLGAFLIEAPGIFIARGNSPLLGLWKDRIQPEDVIINWCSDKPAPKAPAGHHWKEVVANRKAFQIAYYEFNVGNVLKSPKKIMFGATSSVKTGADQKKFDKALHLIKDWDKMEAHIQKGLTSKNKKTQEAALIAWLIKETSIRVGNEDNSEGVVGASTLKVGNIKLTKEN